VPTPDVHARRLLVALVLLAVALTALLVKPFWAAIFVAAVVAAALRAPMEWLSRALRGRRNLAAVVLTLGVLLLALLPFAGLGAMLVKQVLEGVEWLRGTLRSEGVAGLLAKLPGPAQAAAQQLLRAVPEPQQQLQRLAGEQGGTAAAAVGGFLAATGTALLEGGMMLIALFFFLVDGRRLVDWIDARLPLRPGQFRALVVDFRQTSVSVLVSSIGTAAFQTAAAVIGYAIARAPNLPFLAITTFVVALIPALGGSVMVIAVALLLFATGHTAGGLFLLAWGVVVVALSDNVARPWLLKGGMELHGGVVFFALLGGLAVFGGIGLLVGPMILTFLVAVVRLYGREFGRPAQAAGPAGAGRPQRRSAGEVPLERAADRLRDRRLPPPGDLDRADHDP
jgi:predicted PurR-regulated permease PerM